MSMPELTFSVAMIFSKHFEVIWNLRSSQMSYFQKKLLKARPRFLNLNVLILNFRCSAFFAISWWSDAEFIHHVAKQLTEYIEKHPGEKIATISTQLCWFLNKLSNSIKQSKFWKNDGSNLIIVIFLKESHIISICFDILLIRFHIFLHINRYFYIKPHVSYEIS